MTQFRQLSHTPSSRCPIPTSTPGLRTCKATLSCGQYRGKRSQASGRIGRSGQRPCVWHLSPSAARPDAGLSDRARLAGHLAGAARARRSSWWRSLAICPSCTTKRMVATAAHLVDAVIPRVPMRQWVLSLPKRLRPALRADPVLATRVLRIFIDSIERRLHDCCTAPMAVACQGWPTGLGKAALCCSLTRKGALDFLSLDWMSPGPRLPHRCPDSAGAAKKNPAEAGLSSHCCLRSEDQGRATVTTGEVQVSQCAGLAESPSALSADILTT